jgi:hypothetical protein
MRYTLAGLLILVTLVLIACMAQQPAAAETGPAEITLRDFFLALSTRDYETAAALYGGSYDTLHAMNPSNTPDDLAGLWRAGCEVNGLACLPVGRVLEVKPISESETLFVVEFLEKDGSVFILGPCCGAEESAAVPLSSFEFRVRTQNGSSQIMDMPAIIP